MVGMGSFWDRLQRPIFILAPMEDVTDTVFRQVICRAGRPDVFFTEFTNVDGMFSKGERQVRQRLQFDPIEKPIVAQIWGLKPENYFKAGRLISEMGFDGVDINMGCPQRNVVQKGACSALMKNHSLASEIIQATMEGAGDLPVSVKTRIGYEKENIEEWIGFLLELKLAALTVHARTVAEMSAVPAHWEVMRDVVKLRNVRRLQPHPNPFLKGEGKRGGEGKIKRTLIIGNGDVRSLEDAREKIEQSGVDGVMIGRGVFGNPWVFNEKVNIEHVSVKERLELLCFHVDLFEKTWGISKQYQLLKKYFKIYVSGFEGASDLRGKLMETKSIEEARVVIKKIENNSDN